MTARPSEKAIVMRRQGKSLVPTDALGEELMAKLGSDELMVWIKKARNPRQHRKLMALVSLIFKNQSKYPTQEQLLVAIKITAGECDTYVLGDGRVAFVPRSIAFENMEQTAFEDFYDRVIDIVTTKIIPGMKKSDLKRELLGFADRAPANGGQPPRPDRQIDDDMSRT